MPARAATPTKPAMTDPDSADSLTVALVEDNPDHAMLATEVLLDRGHEVVHFSQAGDIVSACQSRNWDVVILDYVLPDRSGLECLEQLAQLPDPPPIIMITASGSEAVAVAALTKGASDYVVKTGRHGLELARAVELAAARHRMKQMAALHQQELERQARTDVLTGLLNRRRLADELSMAALRAARGGEPYAVAMLDVDDFKQINDSLGHSIGDAVLVEFAEALQACFRDQDVLARYGGDEFVAVMPAATRTCRADVVRRLEDALRASRLAHRLGFRLSATVGVADSSAGGPEEVLKAADHAMYRAKSARRHRSNTAPRGRASSDRALRRR